MARRIEATCGVTFASTFDNDREARQRPGNMNTHDIADAYDAITEWYAQVRSPTMGLLYVDRLCERLPDGASVLDVGCGMGLPLTRHLVDRGFRVHGLDISPRMIEKAKQNVPEAHFEVADIVSWTSARTFDGVLAWDCLFHLQPQEHVPALQTLHDALVPGGTGLFTVGGKEGEICSTMSGREFYHSSLSAEAYTDALRAIGFNVLAFERDQPGEEHVVIFVERVS
jgi:SAM-dependent methyltransferase